MTDPRSTALPPAAVLFDLDGTLVDTEGMWRHAYGRLAAAHGVVLEQEWWTRVVGRDLSDASVALLGDTVDTPARRRRSVDQVVDAAIEVIRSEGRDGGPAAAVGGSSGTVTWRPGAQRLLAELQEAAVPMAVVTASPRRLLDVVIDHLGIEVAVTVAGDEVERPKPDPEGYRTAARLLGVDVRDAVVVEDSPTGVAAGTGSGARVLAVPSTTPLPSAPGLTIADSLTSITAVDLAALPRG